MRSILIDSYETDPKTCHYALPWKSDRICAEFHRPEEFIHVDEIGNIGNFEDVETLVIGCDLDDYEFIGNMKNLRQLYMYRARNLNRMKFVQRLLHLSQFYIAETWLGNPQDLMALAFKKKEKTEKNEPVEKLEAVCIQSHVKTLDGMIFAAEGLIEGEIIVNHRRYR